MRILTADHLLPITGEPIDDGAVAIEGSRIAAVGTAGELQQLYPGVETERFKRGAILPGFVNCHSHLELTALRGTVDDHDADFISWLLRVTKLRAEALSDEDISNGAVLGAIEGARLGVTCFGDIGRLGKAGLDALRSTGLRGVVYQETEFSLNDPTAKDDAERLFEKAATLRAEATDLVGIGISPHSPYTVSRKLFEIIADRSQEEGFPLTIHAAESRAEEDLMLRGTGPFAKMFRDFGVEWDHPGLASIGYLSRAGILDARPLLAHCVTASREDVEALSTANASIAHCPKSNAKLGHGIAPLALFEEYGLTTGLGTDSMASNNVCDILEEARFATLAARVNPDHRVFISAEKAIRMATLGGAEALGLDGKIGSIEPGKEADIVVIDLSGASRRPLNDIYSALLFSTSGENCRMTMVAGEEICREGAVMKVDEERVLAKSGETAERLAKF